MQQLTYFVQLLYRSRDILLLSLELEVSHNSKINFFYSNFLFTLSFLLAFKNMVILKRLAPSSKGRGENTNTYRTSESQVPVVVALFPSEAWNAWGYKLLVSCKYLNTQIKRHFRVLKQKSLSIFSFLNPFPGRITLISGNSETFLF